MGLHVDGIENAILEFDRLETVMHSKAIVQIFQVAGDHVANLARARVRVRTGRLQRGIFARAYVRDTVPYVLIGVEMREPAHGNPIVPYSAYVEFGTVHTAAQPFMRPAIDESADQVGELVATAIKQLLETK